jgi:hypothetical protein
MRIAYLTVGVVIALTVITAQGFDPGDHPTPFPLHAPRSGEDHGFRYNPETDFCEQPSGPEHGMKGTNPDFIGECGDVSYTDFFSDSREGTPNFVGFNLRGTNLYRSDLFGSLFQNADLTGAHLEDALLRKASFSDTQMRDAHFYGADLKNASWRGVIDLTGADLRGADLSQAQILSGTTLKLSGAKFNSKTKFWLEGQGTEFAKSQGMIKVEEE